MDRIGELMHKDVLFGLNFLTVAGFVAMAIGLNQSRRGRARAPIAFAFMGLGTVLVIAGFVVGQPGS
jgi:hypothetical protein